MKVPVTAFLHPQQDNQMISFGAELSKGPAWTAAAPQPAQQHYRFPLHQAAEVCAPGPGTHCVCTNSRSVRADPQEKVPASTAQIHFCTTNCFTFAGTTSAKPVIQGL